MGLLDDVVAAKIKEQVNKADEDKQVATNVQAASSVAKTLAEQTGDATVLNNVHAMLFSETPNGDAKAIPQTKESSKALLDMVTTGANLVERIKQSTAYNQSKEMMNQGLQPVTQSTPVPEGTPTTNVGGIDYAPIEGFQSQKQIDRQDKLEKAYTTSLEKVVSFRSGGLGLQDSKVNQAIDLRTMVDGMKDPETGLYNIPPSAHTELAIGFAKLLSPTGVVNQQTIDEIQQKTAKQGLAGALIYLGGDPKKVGGTTQSVAQFMIHAIDRQGTTAETLRDKYMNGLKGLVPAGLDKKNAERLAKQTLTSSFKDYLSQSSGDSSKSTPMPSRSSAPKGAKGWDTEKGSWVF